MKRLAAAAAVVALAACSGSSGPFDWMRSAPAGPKPADLPPLTAARPVKLLWSARVGSGEPFVFSPALAGDSVYAAARDGTVVRLEAAKGQARWRVSVRTPLSGGVGADGRLAVVVSEEGEVFALEADSGKVRWRARVSSEVLAAPKLAEGLVVVRSADSRIFAFDAADGKRRWAYQRATTPLIVRSPAGMTLGQESVFAGFSGGKLVALALGNGGLRWEATVALPKGATELERVTDIVGDPAEQGREVCAAAYQGRVACFDAQNGSQLWSREVSSLTGVSADARFAFVSDDRGSVQAFDRSTGRSLWKQDRLAYRQLSLPLPTGSEVAAGDLQGYVHFMARDSGAFVARVATDGSAIRAAPQRLGDGVLVQTTGGGLYAFAL